MKIWLYFNFLLFLYLFFVPEAELHAEDTLNGGLYEAIRKELRYVVEEI